MKFGYCFTDFPSRMRQGGTYILKCLSFIVMDTSAGDMIFDTGSPTDNATLLSFLTEMGSSADRIKWVFNTHVHPDHAGGNTLFPNATVVLSKRDYEFSVGMAEAAYRPESMLPYLFEHCPGYKHSYDEFEAEATRYYIKHYWSPEKIGVTDKTPHAFIEDNPELPPFVKPIFSPGHTYGHYGFEILGLSRPVLISGDAVSNRFILKEDHQYRMNEPHMDFDAYFASMELFRRDRALIIPSHDRPFFLDTEKTIRKSMFGIENIQ